jgi:hypothetical protein
VRSYDLGKKDIYKLQLGVSLSAHNHSLEFLQETCYSLSPSFHTQVFLQLGRRHLVEALASESALPTALTALARAGPDVRPNVLEVPVAVRTPNASPCSRRSTRHLAAILQRSCRAVLVCTRRATVHSASCTRSTPTRRVMGGNSA